MSESTATNQLKLRYATVDVFTAERFRGNQLAIVEVPKGMVLSQDAKQTIAMEYNYAETIFLHDITGKDHVWTIDIFTTEQELSFAGHPTIGAACYLGMTFPDLTEGVLITKAGHIPFRLNRSKEGLLSASAAIPHEIHVHKQSATRDHLRALQPGFADSIALPDLSPVVSCTNGMNFALFNLESLNILNGVKAGSTVSLKSLITLDDGWKPSEFAQYHYVLNENFLGEGKISARTRMVDGLQEDPATGSAACALAAYLTLEQAKARKLQGNSLQCDIDQGVEMGRASRIQIKVELSAEHGIERITLSGSSVLVMTGELLPF